MTFLSKRWHKFLRVKPLNKRRRKALRRKIRRLRRNDLAWVKRMERTQDIKNWPEKKTDRYNRAVARLNQNLRKPSGGYPICDFVVACPVCGQDLLTFGDPDCWTRNDNPARSKLGLYDVTGYWPGTAQCCGVLIAPETDGDGNGYYFIIDQKGYKAAKAARAA